MLLGYHYTCIHQPTRMMVDVDALSLHFGPIVAKYLCVAALLRNIDVTKRPAAYDHVMLCSGA